jgi:hypothetical protein
MVNRVPPVSEASFRREYSLMWTIAGGACIVVGLGIGPAIARAHRPWLTMLVGALVYLATLLLCRVALISIWRRASTTIPVLVFSLPTGGLCLAAVMIMRFIGPTLQLGQRTLFIFAASLVWAIGVGIRRKAMGEFEVDNRP